ncbi:glycine betaine ABC transporter substrate-binding protein [Georgenia sp. Z1491]|uniref:glycine betaine ABC transporter substrate-binding protein n=1 Tax=Georgenia sp. Z1491 TaxID=3416707 RepID=UPI003CF07980
MRTTTRRTATTAVALALTLSACGGEDDDGASGGGSADAAEPIVIGIPAGWEEALATGHLWQRILEDQDYEVELEIVDMAVLWTGLAEGQYDLNFDVWLPEANSPHMAEYGDRVEEIGMWYEEAPMTIAVNEDAPITSLAELAENADEFDNRIVGIESGAVLTSLTENEVIPTYGLEDMEYVTSSTTAMLAEVEAATSSGDNIVVTLWRPHWAYDAFPIRDLEDPEGALGVPDDIYVYGHLGFAEEYPEVAEWLSGFYMTSEELHSLENIMFNEMGGESNDDAVDQWLEDNPDYVDAVLSGEVADGAGAESGSESGSESASEDGAETES